MSYTSKCLGPQGVGILGDDDKLTIAARDAFTTQVVALLTSGNRDGKGAKISSLIGIAFPPPAGIKLFDPDRLLSNPNDLFGDLFWFDPSPFAPLTFDTLRDPNNGYQKIIVDNLYAPLMKAMNLNGNAIAPPILDFSGFLPPSVKLPDLPKIALAFTMPNPLLALKALSIDLGDIPEFILNIGKIISIPSLPNIPTIPVPEFDFIVFPALFKAILELPGIILPQLIVKLDPLKLLVPSPPELFGLVVNIVFGLILDILKKVGLLAILPKLLSATFIVMIQNVVIATLCMTVSQVIGTGIIVKTIGQALGLA